MSRGELREMMSKAIETAQDVRKAHPDPARLREIIIGTLPLLQPDWSKNMVKALHAIGVLLDEVTLLAEWSGTRFKVHLFGRTNWA